MKKFISLFLSLILVLSATSLCFADGTEDTPLKYVVIGDSIARGAGLWNPDEAVYGRIVANTNGYEYHNYAVDGTRTCDLIGRIKESEVAESIRGADIISISVGGNDFLRGNIAAVTLMTLAGNRKMLNEIIDTLYSNFCIIIDEIKELNPDAVILVQTLYNSGGLVLFYPVFEIALESLNGCFYRYQQENPGSIEIVDIYSAFKLNGINVCGDTIHPNAGGNKIIAREVLVKLNELGLGDSTEPVIVAEPVTTISPNPVNLFYLIVWLINKTTAL